MPRIQFADQYRHDLSAEHEPARASFIDYGTKRPPHAFCLFPFYIVWDASENALSKLIEASESLKPVLKPVPREAQSPAQTPRIQSSSHLPLIGSWLRLYARSYRFSISQPRPSRSHSCSLCGKQTPSLTEGIYRWSAFGGLRRYPNLAWPLVVAEVAQFKIKIPRGTFASSVLFPLFLFLGFGFWVSTTE